MVPTGFSGLFDPHYSDYFKKMALHMKSYDMQVFLSDNYRDINFAREQGISKFTHIPNGAGADEFLPESKTDIRARLGIPADNFLILHIGSYTGIKGHREALDIFLNADISNSTLLLIGFQNDYFKKVFERSMHYLWLRFRNRRKNKKVVITFLSRAETVAAYKAADLFLFPSNIECSPIVLFESMAACTPFLTSDVGNSKEIISWSHAGMVLPTHIDKDGFSRAEIKGSAHMLEELYADAGKRNELADAGHAAWKSKFSWEIISKQYESLYLQLLKL
jgi:glycosyltransferase involved in cell wall biosynthesis